MGVNVFIAGYQEFQMGTGSKPNVPKTSVNISDAKYEYGQAGRAGWDTDGDGYREVDCSSLVWRALKDSGYKVTDSVSGFTTRTLFNKNTFTKYATDNFNRVDNINEDLQPGDIIAFKSKNGSRVGWANMFSFAHQFPPLLASVQRGQTIKPFAHSTGLSGGEGADILMGESGNDTLEFGSGITTAGIKTYVYGNDLSVEYGNNEGVWIYDGYKGAIENFRFANGITLDWHRLLGISLQTNLVFKTGEAGRVGQRVLVCPPITTIAAPIPRGQTIKPFAHPTRLDTIRIADGLVANDIKVSRDPWDLFLTIKGTDDKLTLNDWFTFDAAKVGRVGKRVLVCPPITTIAAPIPRGQTIKPFAHPTRLQYRVDKG